MIEFLFADNDVARLCVLLKKAERRLGLTVQFPPDRRLDLEWVRIDALRVLISLLAQKVNQIDRPATDHQNAGLPVRRDVGQEVVSVYWENNR